MRAVLMLAGVFREQEMDDGAALRFGGDSCHV